MRFVDLIGFIQGSVRVYHKGKLLLEMLCDDTHIIYLKGNEDIMDTICWRRYAYVDALYAVELDTFAIDIVFDDERED